MSSVEERRARRKARAEERLERRLEFERLNAPKKKQKKKSSSIPAKWHWRNGVKIAGVEVRGGFFYAGSNMSTMACPDVLEPSLLDPRLAVADSSVSMDEIGFYPIYQYMTEEQRRGYIEFLASDRTRARDIGFVFMYLYGFERRLLVDDMKKNLVTDEEREDIVKELVRIFRVFGGASKSLMTYVASLLLYNEKACDDVSNEDLEYIIVGNNRENGGLIDYASLEAIPSLSKLAISRLSSRKMSIPENLIEAGAKGRLMMSPNFDDSMLRVSNDTNGIGEPNVLFSDCISESVLSERLKNLDISTLPSRAGLSSVADAPEYSPASVSLRKAFSFSVDSTICVDPENIGYPMKALSDVVLTAFLETKECADRLSSGMIRYLDEPQLDCVSVMSPDGCALDDFLSSRNGATYVPMKVIADDIERRFGRRLSFTSSGFLDSTSQKFISVASESLGWHAILPSSVESPVSRFWRVRDGVSLIMFKRGKAHNRKNGKRVCSPIFGDDISMNVNIPGNWDHAIWLMYIFSWFVSQCSTSLGSGDLSNFSSSYYPEFSTAGSKKNQIALFFSMLHATFSYDLNSRGIKMALDASNFDDVMDLVFSLCNDKFGNIIPTDVMDALEALYSKSGHDPRMILHDYQSGSYTIKRDSSVGFSIDSDKLAETILMTSDVHSMLNDAIDNSDNSDDLDTIQSERDDVRIDDSKFTASNDDVLTNDDDNDNDNSVLVSSLVSMFGDRDEMPSSELIESVISGGFATTSAEAVSWVLTVGNEGEIVEIDGSDAYLNI